MQLKTLLGALEEGASPILQTEWKCATTDKNIEITSLAYDSRLIQEKGLFVAIAGTHADGRNFLADAAQRGAVVALGEPFQQESAYSLPLPYIEVRDARIALANLACAFYGYPSRQLCTIGVTGTDGKTTTSNLICAIFEEDGRKTGLMATTNFRIAGKERQNNTRQSTLEALEVQQLLRYMANAGATHAVVEVSSHGLELQRVRNCEFDVGVVTNITHEHLDFHKTIDNYRRAKARLFEMLKPTSNKGVTAYPVAILNRDDSSYELLKAYCRVPVLDYGIEQAASVRAVDIQLRASSTRFRVLLPDTEMDVETQLIGSFNVSNCLAAIATAFSQGVKPTEIAHGLAKVTGVTGRMESIQQGQPFKVLVDYAHTPDGLQKVLATLRPLTEGKLLLVFGSAGERDIQKRPIMGRIAAQMTDFFVITDEDPREEDREHILQEIARGAKAVGKREGCDFLCIADRRKAIAAAFTHAHAGDTILLAGKGHEQSIFIGKEKIAWDDRQVAREELYKL
ncbi:MAG: UDP-N-acetylmuramoyl-L-alanyl-D-glutamate--2,6-diaminopimelate ligase [Ktedonobacteraceae bacterium]